MIRLLAILRKPAWGLGKAPGYPVVKVATRADMVGEVKSDFKKMSDHGENRKSGNTTISLTLWDLERLRLNRRGAQVRLLAILCGRWRRERTWWERLKVIFLNERPC